MSSKKVHFVDSQKVSRAPRREEGRKKTKKTKTIRRKPEWDTTVNDLSVYKLSRLEVEKRHKNHESKNAEVAKHDLYEKARGSYDLDTSGNLRPSPLSSTGGRKQTVLQKSLHGKELHEVLAESDRALRVVKDLFGDDPKRYTCQPNVTVAPHIINDKKTLERTLLENQRDGPHPTALASPGGIRDESLLEIAPRKPALNDLPSPQSLNESNDADISSLGDATPSPGHKPRPLIDITPTTNISGGGYQSAIDLKRFQTLLDQQQQKERQKPPRGPATNVHTHVNTDRQRHTQTTPTTTSLNPKESKQQNRQVLHVQMPSMVSRDTHKGSHDGIGDVSIDGGGGDVGHFEGAENDDGDDGAGTCSLTGISELSSIPADVDRLLFEEEEDDEGMRDDDGTAEMFTVTTMNDKQKESTNKKTAVKTTTVKSSSSKQTILQGHPLHVVHKKKPVKQDQQVLDQGGADVGYAPQPPSAPLEQESSCNKIHNDLKMLEKLVLELDKELHEYEKATCYPVPLDTNIDHSRPKVTNRVTTKADSGDGTLSGITITLLSSVRKVTHYLRQSEVQLKGEIAVRGQLLQTMTEQQDLMDALTTDLVKVREENIALRNEITDLKRNTSEQMRELQDEHSEVHKKLSAIAIQQVQAQSSSSSLTTHHHNHPAVAVPPSSLPYPSYLSPLVPILPTQIQQQQPNNLFKGSPPSVTGIRNTLVPPQLMNTSTQSTQKPLSGVVYAQVSPMGSESVKGHQQHTLKSDFLSRYSAGTTPIVSTDMKHEQVSYTTKMDLNTPTSNFPVSQAVHSKHLSTSFTPLKALSTSLDTTFAPSPPPISVALQIPSLSMDTTTAMSDTSFVGGGTPWVHGTIASSRDNASPILTTQTLPRGDTKGLVLTGGIDPAMNDTPSAAPQVVGKQDFSSNGRIGTTYTYTTPVVTGTKSTHTATSSLVRPSSRGEMFAPLHTTTSNLVSGSSIARGVNVSSSGVNSMNDSMTVAPSSSFSSLPMFDVAAFLNSLGKLGNTSKSSQTSTGVPNTNPLVMSSSNVVESSPSPSCNEKRIHLKDKLPASSRDSVASTPGELLPPSKAHHSLSPLPLENAAMSSNSNNNSHSHNTELPEDSSAQSLSPSQHSFGVSAHQGEMLFQPLVESSQIEGPVIHSSSSLDYSTVSAPNMAESIKDTPSGEGVSGDGVGGDGGGDGRSIGGSRSVGSLPALNRLSHKTGWFALSTHLSSQ